MSEITHTPKATDPEDRTGALDRYTDIDLPDETVVIYDRENPRRWIQSAAALPLTEVR